MRAEFGFTFLVEDLLGNWRTYLNTSEINCNLGCELENSFVTLLQGLCTYLTGGFSLRFDNSLRILDIYFGT